MLADDLRIRVTDWDDPDFLLALRDAIGQVANHDAHGVSTAGRVQAALRDMGYAEAIVEYHGAADDVLAGISRWIVRRGPAGR